MDKRVLVMGLGKSGVAAAHLLCDKAARVVAVDEHVSPALEQTAALLRARGVEVRLGESELNDCTFDFVVVSPGIDPQQTFVRTLATRGVPILGELELGYQHLPCPIAAITGTNGKTTTTELIERVFRTAGARTLAAGNIGYALCEAARRGGEFDALSVEVSSFQLETIHAFRPRASILLNITPDHLDRYDSMHDYAVAKARIFENQTANDVAIINADTVPQLTELGMSISARTILFSDCGAPAHLTFRDGAIWAEMPFGKNYHGCLVSLAETHLRGPHNAQNIMATLAVAAAFDIPLETALQAICEYHPLPHRCEFVATIEGVDYINDSKATNTDAVEKALRGFNRPVILIAGGKDKGFLFDDLRPTVRDKVRRAILFGETAPKLLKSWGNAIHCEHVASMEDAVHAAHEAAHTGDCVLLSPACSSFDMFKNFEDRGEQFKTIVRHLANQQPVHHGQPKPQKGNKE